MRRAGRLLAFCGLALGGMSACGLFEPRESEAPLDGGSGQYLPATSPSNVIHNLQEAFGLLEVFSYLQQLSDSGWTESYSFVPDAGEYQAIAGQPWGRGEEEAWLENLSSLFGTLPADARHTLTFGLETSTEQYGDSALQVTGYTIRVEHGLESPPELFSGTASLVFARSADSGDWGLIRWIDQAADTGQGATALRVAFRGF